MAKVYEPQIDPEEFIRTFREEPSGLSSLKKKPANDNATAPSSPTDATPDTPVNTAVPQAKSGNTDLDTEFMEKFVSDRSYMRVPSPYRSLMVDIDREHVQKIRSIFFNGKCSMGTVKGYVSLVLEEHFKKYQEIIKKLNNE
ncbi:MAG: DUF3408 domain-containing protein [Muribaculaceae bacterium]